MCHTETHFIWIHCLFRLSAGLLVQHCSKNVQQVNPAFSLGKIAAYLQACKSGHTCKRWHFWRDKIPGEFLAILPGSIFSAACENTKRKWADSHDNPVFAEVTMYKSCFKKAIQLKTS